MIGKRIFKLFFAINESGMCSIPLLERLHQTIHPQLLEILIKSMWMACLTCNIWYLLLCHPSFKLTIWRFRRLIWSAHYVTLFSPLLESKILTPLGSWIVARWWRDRMWILKSWKWLGTSNFLKRFGQPSQELAIDMILDSLSKEYKQLVLKYNMNSAERTVTEMHQMLENCEKEFGTY